MILNIRAYPKASRSLIKKENSYFKAYLTKPEQSGLANKQLIELLSGHIKVNPVRNTEALREKNKISNGVKNIKLRLLKA